MYQEHFGLQRPVLEPGLPAPDELYVGACQRNVMDLIAFGTGAPDSVTVVSGPHGVGKTVLTQAALESGGTRQATIRLREDGLNAADLPELLLAELGVAAHRLTRVERLQLWRQNLGELETTASRLYVIVERADVAEVSVLRALEVLTAADPAGSAGANLLLHGTSALQEILTSSALEPLCQRVRQRVSVSAMGVADAAAYWRHRVELTGGDPDRLAEPEVPAALYEFSRGVPRVMDRIGDAALTLAAAAGASAVAVAHVAEAARRMAGNEAQLRQSHPDRADADGATQAELPVLTDAVDESDNAGAVGDEWVDRVLSA